MLKYSLADAYASGKDFKRAHINWQALNHLEIYEAEITIVEKEHSQHPPKSKHKPLKLQR